MDIFYAYNYWAALWLVVAAGTLYGGLYFVITCDISEHFRKKGEVPAYAATCWRNYRIISNGLFLVVLAWVAWCVHANYGTREATRQEETALVELASALDKAAEMPFTKRCQFNGHLVSDDWIEADSFPCEDFGRYRIWKNSLVVVSKYNAGDSSKIFVATQAGQEMNKLATYDAMGYRIAGVFFDYLPWIRTERSDRNTAALQEMSSGIRAALSTRNGSS